MLAPAKIGRYVVRKELGSGGFASVYLAFDPNVKRDVAIKLIRFDDDSDMVDRFWAEAGITGKFQHKNIVTVYEFDTTEDGSPYLVMELLEGRTLQQIISEGEPQLALLEKVEIMLQVAEGLRFAHTHQVMHGDIKPSNIMVLRDGTAKIMDFGIGRVLGLGSTRRTRTGYIIGTLAYMAPEQFAGSDRDERSDAFAYGTVYYELLTGRSPWNKSPSTNTAAVIHRIISEEPEPVSSFIDGCPNEIETLVRRLLDKAKESRIELEDAILDMQPILRSLRQERAAAITSEIETLVASEEFDLALERVGQLLDLDPPNPRARDWRYDLQQRSQAKVATGRIEEVASPAIVAPGPSARAPDPNGEPTRMFRAPIPVESVPAAPVPQIPQIPSARAPDPKGEPGEFTRMFQAPVPQESATAAPVPQIPQMPSARAPDPKSEPGEFMRLSQGSAPAPPPLPRPPAQLGTDAPEREPVEFTRAFQTQPKSAPSGAATGTVPDDFTRFYPPSPPPDPAGKSSSPAPNVALVISDCADSVFIGRRANLNCLPFRIGRNSAEVQFALSFDEAVSGVHAEVDFSNGGYVLRDLNSANGTFVGGRRVTTGRDEPLFFGARILLGSNTQIVLVSDELDEIPDLTGRVIAGGRFVLQSKVHSSAKSVVYTALDHHLGCLAAIKILSPGLANYPGYREQFQSEAAAASRLWHTSICPVLDHGEADVVGLTTSLLYVAMKHLDGGSLSERLARHERFDLVTIASWLDRICNGLDHMHQKGVIHSGLKPSAIVFDSEGNPYLTDFAFATRPDADPRAVLGAPGFLAPEQWDGYTPTPATDQYSLGVLMYLLIAGSMPMQGQENPAVREANLQRGPALVRDMAQRNGREEVPLGISAVLHRAIAREPGERFATAGEFAREFRTALQTPQAPKPIAKTPLIFISYHRPSSAFLVLLIQRELEKQGWNVFVDSQQRDTIGRFPRKIERKIEHSDVFLCILAERTLESPWVNREIELAVSHSKPMIPIFQDNFDESANDLAPHVRELVICDGIRIVDTQSYYIEAFMKWLIDSIRQILTPDAMQTFAP